jgi:hypothetical protein
MYGTVGGGIWRAQELGWIWLVMSDDLGAFEAPVWRFGTGLAWSSAF